MTIYWGKELVKDYDSQIKVGYEFRQSPSTVTSSTGLVTVYLDFYLRTKVSTWDTQAKLYWSGSFGSGSKTGIAFHTYTNSPFWSDNNVVKIHTVSRQVTASEAQAIVSSFKASLTNVTAVPGTATVSGSWTTAKKPISVYAPLAPNSVTWTKATPSGYGEAVVDSNATSARPYTDLYVMLYDGDVIRLDDRMPGSTTRLSYGYFEPNKIYRYSVAAHNTAGTSAKTYSPWLYTEPAAPTSFKTTANANGTVTLRWSKPSGAPTHSAYTPSYRIVWRQNGGAWLYDQAAQTTALTWTHTGLDPEIEYEYAIQTVGNVGTSYELESDWTGHTKVRLSSPPLTPRVIGPTEGQPSGTDVSLHFEHNPQDGSEQTGYELEWWTDKDTTVRRVVQTASSWNKVVITTPAVDDYVNWRVRTKGIHPDYSPWTTTQRFGVSARPTVTLLTETGPYWGTSPELRAMWLYEDSTGTRATKYEIRTTDSSGMVLREYAGTTSTPSGSTAWSGSVPAIKDGQTLTVGVRVADSYGVFSNWVSATVTADYARPVEPTLTAVFREDSGSALINVGDLTDPAQENAPTATYELFKYVGNSQWERIATSTTPFEWVDWTPSYGDHTFNLYVVRASSGYPSITMSKVVMLRVNPVGCDQWMWLSSHDDPTKRVRLRGNPAVSDEAGLLRSTMHFYGDAYPTSFSTLMRTRKVSASGELDRESSTWKDWINVAFAEGTHHYRDPWGRNLEVNLDPVNVSTTIRTFDKVSISMVVVRPTQGFLEDNTFIGQTLTLGGVNLYRVDPSNGVFPVLTESGGNIYTYEGDSESGYLLVESGTSLYEMVDLNTSEA